MLKLTAFWWPLLVGVLAIQIGNGLLSTAIGIRMGLAEYGPTWLATVMSVYYVGQVIGSLVSVRVVGRMDLRGAYLFFCALMVAGVVVFFGAEHPALWAAGRFVLGVGLAGFFVVGEAWLNAEAKNETRGRLIALYIALQLFGVVLAQPLASLATDGLFFPTMLTLGCIAVCALAIGFLAPPRASADEEAASASLRDLLRASPLAFVGSVVSGVAWAALMAMAPIYAIRAGFGAEGAPYFLAAAVLGGLALQWSIAALSDRRERRAVLAAISLIACAAAVVGGAGGEASRIVAIAAVAVLGATTFPYYTIASAHLNDMIAPAQRVGANAAMVLLFGFGSVVGPAVIALGMDRFGPAAFFWALALTTGGFAIYAMRRLARASAL